MNWHARYAQQARWTRNLRAHVFNQLKLNLASLVLEVGCGTGAIISELPPRLNVHGLDLDPAALAQCRLHASSAALTQGDAMALPYANQSFDAVYCHFLLLWVGDPVQALLEMKRVARPGGNIIAFAEPDYTHRIDEPGEFVRLGTWQREGLMRQGADPGFGVRLAESFFQAGIHIVETGKIQRSVTEASPDEWEMEWAVIESDLAGFIPEKDLKQMKQLDKTAREEGKRTLHVPTYFAWGSASDS